jgi:hypothetical protein
MAGRVVLWPPAADNEPAVSLPFGAGQSGSLARSSSLAKFGARKPPAVLDVLGARTYSETGLAC